MRRSIAVFLLLVILITSISVDVSQAQSSATIANLEVALWPEFDRHAVLVIYRVRLEVDTPLPAEVSLPMPVDAGEPYAVAWQDEGGQLLNADYVTEVVGEWQIITLTSGSNLVQLEYYSDYELEGTNRNFIFTWPEGFALGELSYEVQEPFSAVDFQLNPPPETSAEGQYGLTYYYASLGSISTTTTENIELSYSNPSDQLSVDMITGPSPISTPVKAEGGTPEIGQILPWLLGGLGVILVFVGGFFYWQSRREPVSAKRKKQRRSQAQREQVGEDSGVDPSATYCHQCGTKASVSDHYCRHCGVPLRR